MSHFIHLIKITSGKFIVGVLVSFLVVCSSCSDNTSNNTTSNNNPSPSTSYPDYFPSRYTECNSQNESLDWDYEIDSIVFNHQLNLNGDHPIAHYSIPRIKCNSDEGNALVDSINNFICQSISFENVNNDYETEGETLEDIYYGWAEEKCHGVSFDYKIDSCYLYLSILADLVDSRGCEEPWFFEALYDLSIGKRIDIHDIPFPALFSLKGYFEFLDKRNWTDSIRNEFISCYELLYAEDEFKDMSDSEKEEAMKEAERISLQHKYYILYSISGDYLLFEYDVNNNYVMSSPYRAFEPVYRDKCLLKEIKPYLSETGKKFIFEKDKSSNTNEILWRNKLYDEIENCLFFEFSTDKERKKIYKLAINYDDPKHVYGYLYDYNGNCEEVKGVLEAEKCKLDTKIGELIIKNIKHPSIENTEFIGFTDKK